MTERVVSDVGEFESVVNSAEPGDVVKVEDGVYEPDSRLTFECEGTENDRIVIEPAGDYRPVIDFGMDDRSFDEDSGVQLRGPYITFRGFEVRNSTWKGVNTDGNADHAILENLDVHRSYWWGIQNNGCDHVTIRYCDSHDNYDPGNDGGNADGFNMTGPSRNGLIEYCRAWNNSDDGFDMWVSRDHTIRNCAAWDNGRDEGNGVGFKLGGGGVGQDGGGHTVYNCIAFNNRLRGIDWNTAEEPVEVYNCTSINNEINYRWERVEHVLRNNISLNGDVQVEDSVDDQYNSWNLDISNPEFVSEDSDSSEFLHLSDDSPCIDAGTDVGIDGTGTDLGAFQHGEEGGFRNLSDIGIDGYQEGDSGNIGGGEPDRITLSESLRLEANDVVANGDTEVQTDHDGYTGDGYINFEPRGESWGEFYLDVEDAGTYEYEIGYALGDEDREIEIETSAGTTELTFPTTEAWDSWDEVTGSVEFTEGEETLRFLDIGNKIANFDYVKLARVDGSEDDEDSGDDEDRYGEGYDDGYEDGYRDAEEKYKEDRSSGATVEEIEEIINKIEVEFNIKE